MNSEELNKYFIDNDINLMNLWFSYDDDGHRYNKYYPLTTDTLEVSEGWYQLIHDLFEELLKTNWDKDIHQIKEKFGGLRFYIGGATEEIFDIISKYEELSYKTCEVCGEKGEIRNDIGWWRTLCNKHYEERKNKYNKEKKLCQNQNLEMN